MHMDHVRTPGADDPHATPESASHEARHFRKPGSIGRLASAGEAGDPEAIDQFFQGGAFQVRGQDVDFVTALNQAPAQILDHTRPASADGREFMGQD